MYQTITALLLAFLPIFSFAQEYDLLKQVRESKLITSAHEGPTHVVIFDGDFRTFSAGNSPQEIEEGERRFTQDFFTLLELEMEKARRQQGTQSPRVLVIFFSEPNPHINPARRRRFENSFIKDGTGLLEREMQNRPVEFEKVEVLKFKPTQESRY